jgi:hypothetical protein
LLLPASWATEITLQSRYPGGILTPNIGEASLLARLAANSIAAMAHPAIAAKTKIEIRFIERPFKYSN